jgi:hypothetical protein
MCIGSIVNTIVVDSSSKYLYIVVFPKLFDMGFSNTSKANPFGHRVYVYYCISSNHTKK